MSDHEHAIRQRDAAYGKIPAHWSAIADRRYLLAIIDELRSDRP